MPFAGWVRVLEVMPALIVCALVLGPLASEYATFRREWQASRLAALLTTLTLLPAFAVGLSVASPLDASPVLQWAATVVVTVVVYSLATAAVRPPGWSRAPRRSP